MQIRTRKIVSGDVTEIYITVWPSQGASVEDQAAEAFTAIAEVLNESKASIFQERVFCRGEAVETVKSLRAKLYGELNDSVKPSWLKIPEVGVTGQFAGVVVHAIAADSKPEIIEFCGKGCGRKITTGDVKMLALSDIQGSADLDRPAQSGAMIEKAQAILMLNGMDFTSVARTWMWLGDILQWYDDFNKVRNEFFIDKGMITKDAPSKMPASTGISVGPIGDGACTLDLVAVNGPIDFLDAGGNQRSAYEYGSAFSRATEVTTPAGQTVYVSGTASIDEEGITTNLNDNDKQIAETIEHVLAVFAEAGCKETDIANAIVYCKTPEVEKLFIEKYSDSIDWPFMTAVTDICRDNLLFEIEALAVKQ